MRISVIIPVYNGEKYLRETIASVRGQTGPAGAEVEIIACDDGSTDGSAAMAESLGCRVLRLDHGGISHACNAGLVAAGGDAVLFLDQDDLLVADALSVLAQGLERGGAEAVSGMCLDFLSPDLDPEDAKLIIMRREPYYGLLNGCILLRKGFCARVGGFSAGYSAGQAVDYVLRAQRLTDILKLPHVTIHRRIHATNTSRVAKRSQYQDYCAILRWRRAGGRAPRD